MEIVINNIHLSTVQSYSDSGMRRKHQVRSKFNTRCVMDIMNYQER